jgi:putative DNA primase/helicase
MSDEQQRVTREVSALADGFRGTDAGNAMRLVAVADGRVRWVRKWGTWIVYQDGVWVIDVKNVLVLGWAKRVAQAMFEFAIRPELPTEARDALLKWAKASERVERLNAMATAARDVAGVLVEHDELDQRHEYLNVLNGTIDLRTRELLPHNPDHLLTRQLALTYTPALGYGELWTACLERWQPDPIMRRYLQEKAGSYATGYSPEELDINLGAGSNGKSKFLGQLMRVLGPYAVVPHKSLLVVQRHEQHETVMADLFGARLAVAAETQRAARIDEEKLKALTGGDQLWARRMREDRWPFWPTHCLVLHTNHRPIIRGVDDGIWRRPKLIPWDVTIPESERDPELAERLRKEEAQTLNWIVDGASAWLGNDQRFHETERVTRASRDYRDSVDTYRFVPLATVERDGFTATVTIYEALTAWRSMLPDDARPLLITQDELSKYLGRRYRSDRRRVNGELLRGYHGVALRPEWAAWVEEIRACCPELLRPDLGDFIPPPDR